MESTNFERFDQIKIITLDTARRNSFAFDDKSFLSSTPIYSIILKNKDIKQYFFLIGLLNSSLLDFYHKQNTIPQAGGFYRYQALFIKDLPIITKYNPEIIKLVDQILAITKDEDSLDNPSKQSQVKTLEKQIDHLVYKLYDLTPEEIEIVEGFNIEK